MFRQMSILVAAALLSASAGCGKATPAADDIGPLPPFSLTERSGLPVGLDKTGMPVWLQLIAPAWAEEKLLGIALAAEGVLGTASERLGTPPTLS